MVFSGEVNEVEIQDLGFSASRTMPKALSTYFSYTGSELPFLILRMKYFSNAILARCTHLPFLNQLTLRGGICGSATKAAPVSHMSARQMAFHVAVAVAGVPAICAAILCTNGQNTGS